MQTYDLSKFKQAHQRDYAAALSEIRSGRKRSHWIWYIFPQLKGLGRSWNSEYYGIQNLDEAKAFLQDAYLGGHLLEISSALLQLDCDDARIVMGSPDNMKLKSSMTLFSQAAPEEEIFRKVLEKFFQGKPDYRTLSKLGISAGSGEHAHKERRNPTENRLIRKEDDNIGEIRRRYPNGLHFVVGDTHGEYTTLQHLMEKIGFDPRKDFAYFVGDYNAGGDPTALLRYISQYYQEDYSLPGFHLIRGNHEYPELWASYELRNLPNILTVKGRCMTYYLTHAGMIQPVFDLIHADLRASPETRVHGYALADNTVCYDAPFRQIIWSRGGLYSQRSHYHVWPSEESLYAAGACIIHGHTPFSQLKKGDYYSYGDRMLLWEKQRIWFAEDLQSFDIDSNVKGRMDASDPYRGLSCVCLEILDEIAEKNNGFLSREAIRNSENFVFAVPYTPNKAMTFRTDLSRILEARPLMKCIGIDPDGNPRISD